jgi:hypothetical protein
MGRPKDFPGDFRSSLVKLTLIGPCRGERHGCCSLIFGMITLIVVVSFFLLSSLGLAIEVLNAPEGHEDEEGFHSVCATHSWSLRATAGNWRTLPQAASKS